MNSVETRNCGGCENFDRYNIGGEPVGTIKSPVTKGKLFENVQLGLCRAPLGLSLGKRPETAECVHPELKKIPISITEVQPPSTLVESR